LKNVEEMDDEEVDDRMEWLEERDKIGTTSKKNYAKSKKLEKQERESLLSNQEKAADLATEKQGKFKTDVKKFLDTTDTIQDFNIKKTEKTALLDFITKPSVKVGKNKYITGLQQGLKDASTDNKKLILLAKMIKNNFDISDVKIKANTKNVGTLKKNLQRSKNNNNPVNSGSSG